MASRHLQKVASQLKFLVSSIIQNELQDPRLGFVTVLEVEPTTDYKEAKVHVSVLGSEGQKSKSIHALEDARGYIQRRIGDGLRLRQTPVLRFVLNTREEDQDRFDSLLEKTKASDLQAEDPEAMRTSEETASAEKSASPDSVVADGDVADGADADDDTKG